MIPIDTVKLYQQQPKQCQHLVTYLDPQAKTFFGIGCLSCTYWAVLRHGQEQLILTSTMRRAYAYM